MSSLDVKHILDCIVWLQAHRVGDEAILVLLDLSDHLSLQRSRHVVVDDTEASEELRGGKMSINDPDRVMIDKEQDLQP